MAITDKPVDLTELLKGFTAPDTAPVIPDEVAAQARELDQIRKAVKILKKREDVLRPLMHDFLDSIGQESVAENGVSISRSEHERTGVDIELLKTRYRKVHAAVETRTPVKNIRVDVA